MCEKRTINSEGAKKKKKKVKKNCLSAVHRARRLLIYPQITETKDF